MSNMVTLKQADFYYRIPMHEFVRYWIDTPIEIKKLPADIPNETALNALKRGKGYKRTVKAYEQKGSGKHDPTKGTL